VWEGRKLFQSSTLNPELRWEVPQTIDTIDPGSSHYNAKSAYAKTLQRDGATWGEVPVSNCKRNLAHDNSSVSCQVCHTSWATSCFGCHLPMRANQRTPLNKFEGIMTRNFTSYNPQVVRDDVFMLGRDGTIKDNRLAVIRSSSAVVVGSQNANREWVYSQQQTVSAEGYHAAGRILGRLRMPTVVVQEGGYDLDTIGGLVREFLSGIEEGGFG